MRSVLVAPIGDHPVVITAAVDALAGEGINIAKAYILYSDDPLIKQGVEWTALELNCDMPLDAPLPFVDANSEVAARQYLQKLAWVLQDCENDGDEVHLLLAGGRKNMSALTGVIAQFFPSVKKLWHLLDRHEKDPQRRNLFSVGELAGWSNEIRQAKMHPPKEDVILFEVPSPPPLSNAAEIRKAFAELSQGDLPSVTNSSEIDAFWNSVFAGHPPEPLLEIWLSQQAIEDFDKTSGATRNNFLNCFRRMTNPKMEKVNRHPKLNDFETDCYCLKLGNTQERPFYYIQNNRVVLCRLTLKGSTFEQLVDHRKELWRRDHPPLKRLTEVISKSASILVIPLGETQMIAAQAYTLLNQETDIKAVTLLYPELHPGISQIAKQLARDFSAEKVPCEQKAISGLKDVLSKEDCEVYLKAIAQNIIEIQQRYPDAEVHLLLSGGRKSMATLNLFAAQRAGLTRIWHTLAKDLALEQQLEDELKRAPNASARREILFLRRHSLEKFDLFSVPVFPML
jgi:CRISPR-associated Csx14 family protein